MLRAGLVLALWLLFAGVAHAEPPRVTDLRAIEATDTTLTVGFTVHPHGETAYRVRWTDGQNQGEETRITGGTQPVPVSLTLAGLQPGRLHQLHVTAVNKTATVDVAFPEALATLRRVDGDVGVPLTVADDGTAATCPGGAIVDWGDHTTSHTPVTCSGGRYAASAEHTYGARGHYRVRISYDTGTVRELVVVVGGDPPGVHQLRATDITDTTAKLQFYVATGGVVTEYDVAWGAGTLGPTRLSGIPGVHPRTYALTGLRPAERYVVTANARNANGEVTATYAFTTAPRAGDAVPPPTPPRQRDPIVPSLPAPLPPPPATAPGSARLTVAPQSGRVRVRLPGARSFAALHVGGELPDGSELDTRHGRVTLSAPGRSATFWGGRFKLSSPTTLTLSAPLGRCPGAAARRLWGDGTAGFRVRGRFSEARPRGARWLVQDSCASTLTRVSKGVVEVRRGRRSVLVRAGKRYVAYR